MGLGDIVRRVLTRYEGDASSMVEAAGKAARASAEFGKAVGEAVTEANEKLTGLFEGVDKLSGKFEGIKRIADFMWEGYIDGVQDARNATLAAGVDIDRLKESSHGLVTENDLLALSAKASSSAFKNGQEDIENATRAIVALERRNVSAAEAQELVTTALTTGRTRGLEPYGLVVDRHIKDLQALGEENLTLAQKEELHARALKGLATLSADVVDGQDAQGESMQRNITGLKDAWDDLKKAVGQLVIAIEPLIGGLAKLVSLAGDIISAATGGSITGDIDTKGMIERALGGVNHGATALDYAQVGQNKARVQGVIDTLRDALTNTSNEIEITDKNVEDAMRRQKEAQERYLASLKQETEYNKRVAEVWDKTREEIAKRGGLSGALGAGGTTVGGGGSLYGGAAVNGGVNDAWRSSRPLGAAGLGSAAGDSYAQVGSYDYAGVTGKIAGIDVAGQQALTKSWQDRVGAYDKKKSSFLENAFGKVGDFDLYKKAFDSLSGGVGAAMGAWIDGSMSAGEAFKKFVGEAVKSLAIQMSIEALKHGAYALGSLAFGDLRGAAAHGLAAAEFAAGAAVAAIAAKELGGGSSSTAAGAGGAASSGSSGSSSSAGGSTGTAGAGSGPIIVYGDSFADDSPRSRRRKAEKMVATALGAGGHMRNG